MFIVIFIPIGEVIILFSQFGDSYKQRGGEYIPHVLPGFRPSKKEKKKKKKKKLYQVLQEYLLFN
jgi:hypothetical protein